MNRWITIIVIVVGIAGCSQRADETEKGGQMTKRTITEVLKDNTDKWMAIPGVEGTAIGLFENKPCIKIFSSKKAEDLRGKIPEVVEGYPVIIEQTGTFHALEP